MLCVLVSSIKNVMSVRAVISRAWADVSNTMSNEEQQFTALVYGVITHLDLHHENVLLIKWSVLVFISCPTFMSAQYFSLHNLLLVYSGSCNTVSSSGDSCTNAQCAVEQGTEVFVPNQSFNIRVNLSDHTGTLKNCRLTAETAEAVLGCSVGITKLATLH